MRNRVHLKELRADMRYIHEWRSDLPITVRRSAGNLAKVIDEALVNPPTCVVTSADINAFDKIVELLKPVGW